MMIKSKSVLALAMMATFTLSIPAQAAQPDDFISLVMHNRAPNPAAGMNGAWITSDEHRRDICALFLGYAALLRSTDQTPNDSIKKLNIACINRMNGNGWGKVVQQ